MALFLPTTACRVDDSMGAWDDRLATLESGSNAAANPAMLIEVGGGGEGAYLVSIRHQV